MVFRPEIRAVAVVTACALVVGGCSSMGRALGVSKISPDEFRVVTKAPLEIPPDYNLRPPRPGDPRPQEVSPTAQARGALLGNEVLATMSSGERMLLARSGGDIADPTIRAQVNAETASLSEKDEGFADRLLFWGSPAHEESQLESDREAERLSVDDVTGGGRVEIEQRRTTLSLPGL